MSYFDVAVIPVPTGNKEKYREHAVEAAPLFLRHGALRVIENWGDDVSPGEVTSFPMAVKCEDGEDVVVSLIEWKDKASRDEAWPKVMEAMQSEMNSDMPFDGKRMIFGGFSALLDEKA